MGFLRLKKLDGVILSTRLTEVGFGSCLPLKPILILVFGATVSHTGIIEDFDASESMAIPYRRPVSPASEERLKEIIQRLKAFGKHHGADPKSWFYDFDKNNKGMSIVKSASCLINKRLGKLQSIQTRNASKFNKSKRRRFAFGKIWGCGQ